MRTEAEIVERIQKTIQQVLSFEPEVLIKFLTFEGAQDIRKEGMTAEDWGVAQPLTREAVLQEASTYMRDYGWPKCMDHRGISAGRTIQKMTAWMWLIEDTEAVAFIDDDSNYAQYGAPSLKFLCERFGWPIPDDGPTQRMMEGAFCGSYAGCGCG